MQDAVAILEKSPDVSFVKLRRLDDIDNYGKGLVDHQPWTVTNSTGTPDFEVVLSLSGSDVYLVQSSNTGFTFNPILIRRTKLLELLSGAVDDPQDLTPLRSGENVLDDRWRSNPRNLAAVIDGPFAHIGFHRRRNYLWPYPLYVIQYVVRSFRGLETRHSKF
jgi:hypothetical protein